MTRFMSILRASLVVIVVIASIVCSSNAAVQYVNGYTIFGSCANFSIQAGTSVSFAGEQTNIHTGSIGVSPGTSITGSPQLSAGYTLNSNTVAAQTCTTDEGKAYSNLAGITCTNNLTNSDLSGVTLFAGVYCSNGGSFTLKTSTLSLDAQGDSNAQFIFKMTGTLQTSTQTSIILLNGALIKNIYWQVGTSAALGLSSSFYGQIFAQTLISVGTSTSVSGRLYTQAAVTFAGTDQVTLPSQY